MPGFMDLPREIRTMIYEYCLVVSGTIVPYEEKYSLSRADLAVRKEMPTVALLVVNKTIEVEAAEILFGNNVWRITTEKVIQFPFHTYFNSLWARRANLFRKIAIVFDKNDFESKRWYEHVPHFRHQDEDGPSEAIISRMHLQAERAMMDSWYHRFDLVWEMPNLVSAVFNVDRLYCPTCCCRRRLLRVFLEILRDECDANLVDNMNRAWVAEGLTVRGVHTPGEKDMVLEHGFQVDET